MAFDDLLVDGQPRAGAFVLALAVQALEGLENARGSKPMPLSWMRISAAGVFPSWWTVAESRTTGAMPGSWNLLALQIRFWKS